MFDEHTHLCLHWCHARLSAVVKLSTSAAVVLVHISHKICSTAEAVIFTHQVRLRSGQMT